MQKGKQKRKRKEKEKEKGKKKKKKEKKSKEKEYFFLVLLSPYIIYKFLRVWNVRGLDFCFFSPSSPPLFTLPISLHPTQVINKRLHGRGEERNWLLSMIIHLLISRNWETSLHYFHELNFLKDRDLKLCRTFYIMLYIYMCVYIYSHWQGYLSFKNCAWVSKVLQYFGTYIIYIFVAHISCEQSSLSHCSSHCSW